MKLEEYLNVEDFKIDKDDIVNIAAAKFEEDLLNKKDEFKNKLTEFGKKVGELTRTEGKLIQEFLDKKLIDKAVKARKALSEVNIEVKESFELLESRGKEIKYVVKFELMNATADTSGIYHIKREDSIKKPKNILKLGDQIDDVKKEAALVKIELQQVLSDLDNMDVLIRRSRATLTKELMNKFDDGKNIVDRLISDVSMGTKKINEIN